MNELPLVSIITPSYNQAQFLEATILSVLNQDYPNLEYIIVDGGSTDGTLEILKRYSDQITWISEPDQGQSDGFNKGVARAKGDVIGWLNSDDLYEPGAIRQVVQYFVEHPDASVVYGNCTVIDDQGQEIEYKKGSYTRQKLVEFWREWYQGLFYSSTFYHRRVFDKVGDLDVNLQMAMDYEFLLRVGEFFDFHYLDADLSRFRRHGWSKSSRGWDKFMVELRPLVKNYWRRRDLWRYLRYSLIMRLHYGQLALNAFTSHTPFEGKYQRWQVFLRAIQLNPTLIFMPWLFRRGFRRVRRTFARQSDAR